MIDTQNIDELCRDNDILRKKWQEADNQVIELHSKLEALEKRMEEAKKQLLRIVERL